MHGEEGRSRDATFLLLEIETKQLSAVGNWDTSERQVGAKWETIETQSGDNGKGDEWERLGQQGNNG